LWKDKRMMGLVLPVQGDMRAKRSVRWRTRYPRWPCGSQRRL